MCKSKTLKLKPALLNADVTRVERTRHARIASAFDNGAAIGEHGHFVGRDAEAQEETVLAHLGDCWRDALAERSEIELPAPFVDLHGVAAAHRQVGLRFAFEVTEIATHARPAFRIARHAHRLK